MAGKCNIDVRKDLINQVAKEALITKAFVSVEGEPSALQIVDKGKASLAASVINRNYKESIVSPSFSDPGNFYVIEPSDALINKYLSSYDNTNSEDSSYLQTNTPEIQATKASPVTISKVNEFLRRINVDISKVDKIIDTTTGKPIDSNGRAILLKQLVEVVNGKEDVSLTEEAMHFAVEIIEQTNPALFNSMLSSVGNYDLYKSIISDNSPAGYRNIYQKDGKPDIRKIKKEVMGKLLAEAVIETSEGIRSDKTGQTLAWWQHILNWLKTLFKRTSINPFETAAKDVLSGKMEANVEYSDESYLQTIPSTEKQASIRAKLIDISSKVTKEYKSETDTENPLSDDADVNNWYVIGARKVANRVTDKVKAWYKKTFPNREFNAKQKADNEQKRINGVNGHLDFERIIRKFIDPTTSRLREVPQEIGDGESAMGSERAYIELYNYVKDLLSQHDRNTEFYPEWVIYDEKKDEAGTIDLLAIDPTGKAHIYDWKFLSIRQGERDVPWFKQNAFEIQIREYRRILKDVYGVEQFGQTRAIPILMSMFSDLTGKLALEGISIGSADPSQITELKYVPVPVDESTGIPALDKKIKQLENLYKRESVKKAVEGRRDIKAEKLNKIKEVIRLLRAQTNLHVFVDTMDINKREMQALVDKYTNQLKDTSIDAISNAEISDFAASLMEQMSTADMYENVDRVFSSDIKRAVAEDRMTADDAKEVKETLSTAATDIRELRDELREIQREFADRFIGQKNGVTGLLSPQRIIRGIGSKFTKMSKLGLKSLDILYKLISTAQDNARIDALKENEYILSMRKTVLDWAKGKGISNTKIFDALYQKDEKGSRVHKLIDEIRRDFYNQFDENAKAGNEKWFEDNINLENYRKEAKEFYQKEKERIENITYAGDERMQEYKESEDLQKLKDKYDIDSPSFTGWDNFIMKRNIKDREKWYTNEYKAIHDTPLQHLYEYQQKQNKLAIELGYLDGARMRTFTPFLRKTLVDKLLWDGNISRVQGWIDDLAMAEDPSKYGVKDENGNLIPAIPKYYTSDIGVKKTDKEGNEIVDYSDVSEDMFKNLIAYNNQLYKYKYYSEIEDQIETLHTIEEFKGHLATDNRGNVAVNPDTKEFIVEEGNDENTKLLDDYTKLLLYQQKYPQSSTDSSIGVGRVVNGMKKMINKTFGKEVFTIEDKPDPTSMIKTIDALNRARRFQILSGNVLSGAAVMFGNNIQVAAQAGEYFTYRNIVKNETKLMTFNLNSKERELLVHLINTFIPMNDDISADLFKEAGVRKLTNKSLGDWLMILMRKPDQLLEKSVFMSLLDNMMIGEDGRIVNINKYVKDKYKDRYSSGESYRKASPQIKKEIEQLQNTKAISKIASVENGKLVIPGFDTSNRTEIIRLSQLAKNLTQNANGNVTELNKSQMQMNVFTNSMMVFRNWIPGLVATRFAGLSKTADTFEGDRYDIGRIRLMLKLMTDSITSKSMNILNILSVNDKGIAKMDELFTKYAEEYTKRTGEEFTMSREDFFDLIYTNTRNAVKEMIILVSLVSAMIAFGAIAPGKDDDTRTKNLYKLAYRTLDKMRDELTFFYDPRSIQQLFQGSVFPSIGIFTDAMKFAGSLSTELLGSKESRKNNHPLKYLSKLLPLTNPWLSYVAAINPDVAKSLQITIPKTNQMR